MRSKPLQTPTATCRPVTGPRVDASGVRARLRVVDAILTGVHQSGESHFELLRAFTDHAVLERMAAVVEQHGYRVHEFGDSLLIERRLG